jgi:hypothetical protein
MIRLAGSGGAPAFTTTLESLSSVAFGSGTSGIVVNHNLGKEITRMAYYVIAGGIRYYLGDKEIYYRSAVNANYTGGIYWYHDDGELNSVTVVRGYIGNLGTHDLTLQFFTD